jgi:hypothetical protein
MSYMKKKITLEKFVRLIKKCLRQIRCRCTISVHEVNEAGKSAKEILAKYQISIHFQSTFFPSSPKINTHE